MAESFTAQGLFIPFSLSTVKAILAQAEKDVLAGRDLSGYGDQGKNVSKTRSLSLGQILAECDYALRDKDPTNFGLNRENRRVHECFDVEIPL